MANFIKKIILFIAFVSACYLMTLFVLVNTKLYYLIPNISMTTGGYSHNLERFREVKNIKSGEIDVIFLGSSHCYRGFDPRILNSNFSSFNLGNSAQTPYISFYLAKYYLAKLKPKKVILEAYWGSLSAPKHSIESSIDVVSNKEINSNDVEMILKQKNITSFNSLFGNLIYRFNHSIDKEVQNKFKGDSYISGGYVQRISTKNKSLVNPKSQDIVYNPYQISYLIQLIKLCKTEGVEIEIIRAPVTKCAINSISNFNEITQELDSICNSHNVIFKDFCSIEALEKMHLIDTTDFYDLHHLSQSGVTKFNHFLLNKI
jgi:hypothetical protein